MANAKDYEEGVLKVKSEWGIKRACRKCPAHFYDLRKQQFSCPKCETSYREQDFIIKNNKVSEVVLKKETRKKNITDPLDIEIDEISEDIDDNLDEEDLIEDSEEMEEDVHEVLKIEEENEIT